MGYVEPTLLVTQLESLEQRDQWNGWNQFKKDPVELGLLQSVEAKGTKEIISASTIP